MPAKEIIEKKCNKISVEQINPDYVSFQTTLENKKISVDFYIFPEKQILECIRIQNSFQEQHEVTIEIRQNNQIRDRFKRILKK
jgi:hypothetical protein